MGYKVPHCNNVKNARTWVILMLLVYAGQLLGVSAHAANMMDLSYDSYQDSPEATLPCHGDGEKMVLDHVQENSNELSPPQTCCEAGCSMAGCHTASAILASGHNLILAPSHLTNSVVRPLFTSESINSLYRPPILG